MDMDTAQDTVGSLKQFNSQARREIKSLQKKLSKVKASSLKKEQHKTELLLRRRETIEKLRISNKEHEYLSVKVKSLRKELRNENHAKLVVACQNMVTQYVSEIKRESIEGIGPGATKSMYHETKINENVLVMDEKDVLFHSKEALKVGDVMLEGSAPLGYDRGENRHTLEAHKRGAELTGLKNLEMKSEHPDEEDNETKTTQNSSEGNNPQAGGSTTSTALKDSEHEFVDELQSHERWMKSRQTQLMDIKNKTIDNKKSKKNQNKKNNQNRNAVTQFSVNVLYEEREGLEYKCQLAVLRGFTFHELIEEACAHWGLSSEYTFLEDPKSGAIWPASALVEKELPLETSTPLLKLVFREHMSIADLIAQSHSVGAEDMNQQEMSTNSKQDDLLNDLDVTNDLHNPSIFHPHQLERKYRDSARSTVEVIVDSKYFIFRTSWLVRDFIIFVVWFVLMNLYVTSKRSVGNSYWLNQALEKPLMEREFVSAQYDYVPKLNEYGAVPTEAEATTYFTNTDSTSTDNNRYNVYRWYQQLKYKSIHDASQFWTWIEGPLSDLLYGPANSTTTHVPGYLREGTTQLLGKLRFRQLRVKANRGCTVSYLAKSLYDNCYADFENSRQDTNVFTLSSDTTGFTWSSGGGKNGQSTNLDGVWKTYPGDGFVIDFDYYQGRKYFLDGIQRLRLDNWLDLKTRAVVVELTAYSATNNLYLSTHFILEQSSSGLWTTSSQTWTSKLDVSIVNYSFAIDILLYVVTGWLVFSEILQLAHHCSHQRGIKSYCCSFWSLQQNFSIFLFLLSIITRSIYINASPDILKAVWAANTVDVNDPLSVRTYYDLTDHMRLMDVTTTLEALSILASAFRIFQYMKRHSKMSQFTHVFVLAGTEILFFSFMFAFTFFGFVLLGHNIYGSHLNEWSTIIKTFRTLIKMMVGDFNYESMRQVDQVWTPFFFFFYIIFVFMILVNVFLAILNTSYTNVREVVSAEKKRLMKVAKLRPSSSKHLSSMQRAGRFSRKTFGKKAFFSSGIYRKPEDVKKEMDEKMKREKLSSNPWVST